MSTPEMAPANSIARLTRRLATLERALKALQSSQGTLASAFVGKGGVTTYDKDTGARMLLGSGQVKIWQDFIHRPDAFGLIYCDPAATNNYFRIFPPHDSGSGLENAITIQGRTATDPGNVWVYTDGGLYLQASTFNVGADSVHIATGGQLELLELPSLGSATYQLGYNFDGTKWSMVLVTSGEQFKQDIVPAVIDADKLLAIEPCLFRSKDAVATMGDAAPLEFGAIAQQVHDAGMGDLLASYVDETPVAVKYDRIGVALLPVVKAQGDRITALEAENADLKSQLAALSARLDRLEGATT